jgi:CheY-like chemotaxis protein
MTEATARLKAPPKKVLVVDDDPVVRDSVKVLLAHDGHCVETAKTGDEALSLFAEGRFDLVITDYAMPGIRGDALAAAIKARAKNQIVMMLTACADVLEAAVSPFASVDFVIRKPLGLKGLREALAKPVPGSRTSQ